MARGFLHSVWNSVRTRRLRLFIGLTFVLTLILLTTYSSALTDLTIFGPKRYDRLKGKPTIYTATFKNCSGSNQATLRVTNGDSKTTRIRSAEIFINGTEVAAENEFQMFTPYFEKNITTQETNDIRVVLKGGKHDEASCVDDPTWTTDPTCASDPACAGNPPCVNPDHESFLIIEIVGKGCDSTPPTISNPLPTGGSLINNALPVISAQYADNSEGAGIDVTTIRMTVDGKDVTSSASVTPASVSYTPSSSLPEGSHTVTVSVSDLAHNPASLTWNFTTDTIAPVVKITSHQNGTFLKIPTITISGTIDDSTATVTINGQLAQITGNTFILANLTLAEGDNLIHAEAKDAANNIGKDDITITLDTVPPAVTVSSPQPDSFLNMPTITVTGSITELHPAGLWVNEIPVQITGPGFTVSGVPLALEGANYITVRASDLANNETIIIVPVTRDTIPPVVTIATPATGALVNTPQITVSGTVNEPITSITINGIVVNHDLSFNFSGIVTLAEGLNTITVTASDQAMNPGTAIVLVALDSTAPNAPVITQPASPTKVPQINISGTAEPGSTVKLSLLGPGQTVPVLVGTVTATPQGTFIVENVTLAEGTNTFTATATDAANNTSQPSGAISVILDIKPPVITVTTPANNTYTNQSSILVSGTVDETAVLTINGTPITLEGLNFTQSVTLTSGINSIIITAVDPAENPSSTTVLVNFDTTAPVVTITTPQNGALVNTPQITVSGTVSEPVTSVTINNTAAQITGTSFNLTNFTLAEGANTITVTATDRAGNPGTGSVNLTLDTALPVTSLNAPAQAAAGANVSITGSTTDNLGLNLVEVTANGATIWSFTPNAELSTQNSLSYTLSPDLAPGTIINIQARAYDIAGNIGTASAQIEINQGPSGPGYIQGEVYDDTKGLRLEGTTINITPLVTGDASTNIYPPADGDGKGGGDYHILTQADGGYFTEAAAGDYLITLSKTGHTTVERALTVHPEKNSVALDARLTPISTQQNPIDATGGTIKIGSSSQGQGSGTPNSEPGTLNLELSIPAGALTEQADIRLTLISNQGLAGLLPNGWSPMAVIDLKSFTLNSELRTLNFANSATLKVPISPAFNLTPSSQVALVSYDAASHQWMVQGSGAVSADNTFITASINSTGQYAFILPDEIACTAVTGSVVTQCGPTPNSELGTQNLIAASGRVVPPAAPPSVGLSAVGEVVLAPNASPLTPDAFLSSGLIINARVTERFDLFSGEAVVPTDYVQDLVLYKYPCVTGLTLNSELGTLNSGKVGSTFPVTPSHEYTIIDLMMGKVSFEITLPQAEQRGTMVGSDGARLSDTDGNVLVIPQNALTRIVPVETKTIQPALVTGVVGADFTLLRAVEVNLANQNLAQTAELSVPATQGLNTGLPIIVAQLIDVRGAGKLKLVALARLSGSLITSSLSGLNCSNCLNGITTSGTYFFLQAKSPLGFITGMVKDSSGNPYPSALTTSGTCSLVDLTGIDGKYLMAGTVAGFTATATDIYKNDIGAATGTITAANQAVTLNLMIQITPPTVISAVPSLLDSKGFAEPNAAVVITFSEPVDKTTITSANIVLKDAESKVLEGVFSINPENTVVTIYPMNLMKSEAQHTLTISKSIKDLQGYPLGTDFTSQFTVRDTTPPTPPPAGSITGSFPDANGYVTITATQGSAEATGTVLIMNENSGEIVAVKPESNGSFIGKIMAMLGDEIKILSMDQAGNQTLITYITFKSDDGKYLVTSKGGIVTGEGGLKLDIPEGALLGPTVVKITPVTQDQLPHALPERSAFLAGVNIDAGGATFAKPVEISVPAPSNVSDIPEGSMPFVVQPKEHVNPDGTVEKVYVVIDSAKIIDTSDGKRVSSACQPFSGIQVGGYYVFEFPYFTVAIIDGHTYRDVDGIGGYQPVMLSNGQYDNTHDLPIKNAVIRAPGAMNYISYSRADGSYAAFAEVIYNSGSSDICRDLYLTAIHPLTMYRVNLKFAACEPPYNIVHDFNIKLADAATSQKDTTAPAISVNMQVAPEQDAGNENARFTAGTIPVNTNINVPITVTDQEMGAATLTVTYKTPDMTAGVQNSVPLSPPSTPDLYIPVSGESPAVYKYAYTQGYPSPINGCGSQCFRPDKAGAYTFEVKATDAAGNQSTKSVTVRAVLSGSTPDGVDGKPAVDEIIPADGAKEIMVTMPVMVTFSEPVQNVNEDTFQLFVFDYDPNTQQTYANPVPASVYTSIEGGRMRATLQPKNNLTYGKSYKVVLTTGITDSVPNPSSNDALLPLDHQYEAVFTTKVPQVYDLETSFEGSGAGDIALYTHPEPDTRTFAYVTSNEKGWHAVDVTDPTKPFVTYSQNMTNQTVMWRYRGAAVDPEHGRLAITEWIQWMYAGGSQFGYVRFYDIGANPASPVKIGQERLAEEASGVPDKVAISGNFAFITTLLVGLQVVDIDKAMAPHDYGGSIVGGLSTVDLEECPNPQNPSSRNCGSPSDLALIKNNLALIPTFSGSLLVVDVSTPQLPQFISAFRPQGYSAWRIGATDEYAFTDESGNNQVIDLAVTSSGYPNGNIHTIDVTEPTNPKLLGVVKDASGNVVNNIMANDITISKTSGLVYAAAGQTVYVIDIKDPRNPVILNTITEAPNSSGTTETLGYSPALVEKDGWVYLANQQKGLKVLDLDPVEIGIADADPEFTDVVLPGRDYYPALGTKAVTVWGIVSGEPLDDEWELHVNESVANFKIGGKLKTDGKPENSSPATFKTVPGYRQGFATLYLSWDGGSATPWPDKITIKLQAVKKNATLPLMISVNASEQYSYVFTMRHNGNVKLQEVLDGKAAFVYDDTDDDNRLGAYRSTDPENVRRFHYVQEMLNQVVPRKRGLTNPFSDPYTPYKLIDEDGNYGVDAYNQLVVFKDNFALKVNDVVGEYTPSNGYIGNDNTSIIFRKLMKDYGKRRTGNPWLVDGAVDDSWLHKIVDKDTLIKSTKRIPLSNEDITLDSADVLINDATGNTRNDTGLYELYKNVVERFVNRLINEAERYANDNSSFRDRNNQSRNGISYSFGGNKSLTGYQGAATNQTYAPNPYPNTAAYNNYRGNVGDVDPGKQYAGLLRDEQGAWTNYFANTSTACNQVREHRFYPQYWTGIDCSGFVQRMINAADPEINANNGVSSVSILVDNLDLYAEICNTTGRYLRNRAWVSYFFDYFAEDPITYIINPANGPERERLLRLLKQGDLIRYGDDHISIFYSRRWGQSRLQTQWGTEYDIIHASGDNYVRYSDGTQTSSRMFNRKVIINSIGDALQSDTLTNPTEFGRIKLWD